MLSIADLKDDKNASYPCCINHVEENKVIIKIGLLVGLAFSLSACANLGTISRTTELPGGEVAIHLDSPQRLVYRNKNGYVCAEPTPDALQSYANSLGSSLSIPDKGAASVSNAFAANSQSVGLHTQSITLMRDMLYRICEHSHNDTISKIDVMQLLERAQDLTLGVLAIEQLTGAVVARQALVVNTGSADAASAINNTQAQLDIAQRNQDAKKVIWDNAVKAEGVKQAAFDVTKLQLATETAKPANEQDAGKVKALNDALKGQSDELLVRSAETGDALAQYNQAVTNTKAIENMLGAVVNGTQANVGGTGSFGDPITRGALDKESIAEIAQATKEIVSLVVTKGHLTDSCMTFFSRLMDGTLRSSSSDTLEIRGLCSRVISADIENNKEYYSNLYKKTSATSQVKIQTAAAASTGGTVPANAPGHGGDAQSKKRASELAPPREIKQPYKVSPEQKAQMEQVVPQK